MQKATANIIDGTRLIAEPHLTCTRLSSKGSGRMAFEGTYDEVVADIQLMQALGCYALTFDLPRGDVAGMMYTMEQFVRQVKPAVS